MKKIMLLIINSTQFGYHTDTFYYCKYLRNHFSVIYLCWNQLLPRINMKDVKIIYVSRKGNFAVRGFRYFRRIVTLINILPRRETVIFIKYFKLMTSVVRIYKLSHNFMLDIRTASVCKKRLLRFFYDVLLKFELLFFQHITVISKSLATKLRIRMRSQVLPLGAEVLSQKKKDLRKLDLLYVGTLDNRRLEDTIIGFKAFFDRFKNEIDLSYTIIGSGRKKEENELRKIVKECKIDRFVHILGYVAHEELKCYFDSSNIGVSYIPMTAYFDCQPATKTYEYLLSGLVVIATGTSENKIVIKSRNGVIIEDNSVSFSKGLNLIWENWEKYNAYDIRKEYEIMTWTNIVTNNLEKYIINMLIQTSPPHSVIGCGL